MAEPEQNIDNPEPISWESEVCEMVMAEWDKGQTYVSEMNNLYEDIYAMIRGERPEKNYDWQSNIVINKVFQTIWTAIPYLMQKIWGASPIIGVSSFDKKGAWQREKILEFWYNLQTTTDKKHISFFLITVMWLLRSLLNGVGIVKKGWHQKLKTFSSKEVVEVPTEVDESGNILKSEQIEQNKKRTIPLEDWPVNVVCNNRDIVVDWMLQPGQSIRHGRFVIHRSLEDLDSLRSSETKYINLDYIASGGTAAESSIIEDHATMTSRDGLDSPPQSDIYSELEVYERVGKFPVYKKRVDGRWIAADKEDIYNRDLVVQKEMIITIAKVKDKKTLIRFDQNEYDQINYVDMHIYLDEERWQSVGMVEPIKDLVTAQNDNINAVFDKIWQELMPPVIIDKFALWEYDTMEYAPRQRWLVGGNPNNSIMFKEASGVTRDAYSSHALFDSEISLTSAITPPMQGMGAQKAATTNVLNAQMSAGKLDFIVKMIETTGLIPCAQMDIYFAKKFAHPLTFQAILGEPLYPSDWEEIYKYVPCATGVKLEQQKETEIQQDIQLIQIFSSVNNPNMPKILNVLWGNILRNRNMPKEAATFDEEYFEPTSDSGNVMMIKRMMEQGKRTPSNQNNVPMSTNEKGVRSLTYEPQGLPNG